MSTSFRIPILPAGSLDINDTEVRNALENLIEFNNSILWAKISGTTVNAGSGINSVTNPSTGVYTFTFDVVYQDADNFSIVATAEDAVDDDLTCTCTATTDSTATIEVKDIDGNNIDPDHLMVQVIGRQ